MEEVHAARERISAYLPRTALRSYATLDAAIGDGIKVLVKHENHLPTGAFKVRNGVSALTSLSVDQRKRGVICGSRGNHGQGVAFAALQLGVPATVVVPHGNNPEKNDAMRGFSARLIECGSTYDEAVAEAARIADADGCIVIHSTNNRDVLAGAATISLEIAEDAPDLDAIVLAIGGGSQAVGACIVFSGAPRPVAVYGVQALGAPAVYESWKARRPVDPIQPATIADGIATAESYAMTLDSLCHGLRDFVTVTDEAILDATRLLIRTTHNLTEPSGGAGLAGLFTLRDQLAGKTVAVVLSGSNADASTLRRLFEVGAGRKSTSLT
jgi:threonine dehydratase